MAPVWVRNAGTSALVVAIAGIGMVGTAQIKDLEARLHAGRNPGLPQAARTGPPVVVLPASPSRHMPPSRPAVAAAQPGQRANLLAAQGPSGGQPGPTAVPTVTPTSPAPGPSPSATPSGAMLRADAQAAGFSVHVQAGGRHG